MNLTEDEQEESIKAFNPPRGERIKTMAAMIAMITMSRIINYQMGQAVKVFKNSMKEFSREERDQIQDMASQALLEPIDKHIRKVIVGME